MNIENEKRGEPIIATVVGLRPSRLTSTFGKVMRFVFDKTPIRQVIAGICDEYHLSLDDDSMLHDVCITGEFDAGAAEWTVHTILKGTPFSGWIVPGWVPGETLIIHDDRELEKPLSYEHDKGTLVSLLRGIPQLYSLGLHCEWESLREVAPFSADGTVRQVLDVACAQAGLRWRLDRGMVYISHEEPNQSSQPPQAAGPRG